MRTKTLVLAALASTSAIGLMAQTNVYSLNAVGYINVTCNAGFTMISDQLWNNPGTPNYIGTVLPTPSSGADDFDLLYKWTGSGFVVYTMDSSAASGWDSVTVGGHQVDPSTNVTLNPGEAAFFDNVNGTATTFTFVGTVPQGTNTVAISSGFNLISSVVPQGGHLHSDLGFPIDPGGAQDFDTAYLFSNTAGYTVFTPDSATSSFDPSDPVVAVGTGLFYVSAGPVTWTRVFSVNQ